MHHSLKPDSAFASSLIALAYPFARSPGALRRLILPYIIAAGHGLAVGTPCIMVYSCIAESELLETCRVGCITGRADRAVPGREAPRVGRIFGVSTSSAAAAKVGTDKPLSFLGSVMVGGGVSRESIRPMASIAPPSISVRSLIVAELCIELSDRVGERSGRLGPLCADASDRCGEESVLIMVGKGLLRFLGETALSSRLNPLLRAWACLAGLGKFALYCQLQEMRDGETY